jgi:hypothetical protein
LLRELLVQALGALEITFGEGGLRQAEQSLARIGTWHEFQCLLPQIARFGSQPSCLA